MDQDPIRPVLPKPAWIRVRAGEGAAYRETLARLRQHALHTVCEEALCPNRGHCWSAGRATILILGSECTRRCRFCHVGKRAALPPPDPAEPARVAAAVAASGLREVVLTSVTRDDLPDGGAALWAETVRRIRGIHQWPGDRAYGAALPPSRSRNAGSRMWERRPAARSSAVLVEVLVPDFAGNRGAWQVVADSRPDIFGHNLETVPRLYPAVRPEADYRRSLELLRFAAGAGPIAKTSLMLGMGETPAEVAATLADRKSVV